MTTTADHDEILPLLAGEALGGLDDEEERRLRAHRSTCDRCAADALSLAQVEVDLALTAPARRPPPDLGARIMAAALASDTTPVGEAVVVADAHDPRVPAGATGRHWWSPPRVAVAIGAFGLIVVLAFGSFVAGERSRLDAQIAEQAALIAVLADPDHVESPLTADDDSNIDAMAVYSPGTTDAFVMATGLPATPADHVYQLWSADAAGVHALGTFTFDGHGTFVAPFGVDLSAANAAMVTLEPTGGAVGEPGPQVVFGELSNAS